MKIYYAHCMAIYNTMQEQRDMANLQALGFDVVNPNCAEHQEGCLKQGMAYFEDVVDDCDAIAFRAVSGGKIPAGVFKEIEWAKVRAMPIIELPNGILGRGMSVEETREYLKEAGAR